VSDLASLSNARTALKIPAIEWHREQRGVTLTIRQLVRDLEFTLALLREIEWPAPGSGPDLCPACNGLKPDHTGTCKLKGMIG